ncbi:MAG: hypothetical protein ACJAZO_003086 [Myxococcota bacterium]|jgi:hypothetical protein
MGIPGVQMPTPLRPQRKRRGNYAVLFVLAIPVVLGFGALAVDTSFIRLSQSQTQDVADAASQAALVELRRTGSTALAREAALAVVDLNIIAGAAGTLKDLEFGVWDEDGSSDGDRLLPADDPNAVRATVAREGGQAIPLFLAKIWGYNSFTVERNATSASRKLQVVLVMDITNSWSPRNFDNARIAAMEFFDTIADSHGPDDQIGMSLFSNRFGWEFTPLTGFDDDATVASMRADWDGLRTASKAGEMQSGWPSRCSQNSGANQNNFAAPSVGGCFPNMPREYRDEPGTDHSTGMQMAYTMFDDGFDTTAFRVMLVLTDGQPANLRNPGVARELDGYTETRWREYLGPAPRSAADIRTESVAIAQEMWDDLNVHTYVVSFKQDDAFMRSMAQGQGYFIRTDNSNALVPIFRDIANSLPLALVE